MINSKAALFGPLPSSENFARFIYPWVCFSSFFHSVPVGSSALGLYNDAIFQSPILKSFVTLPLMCKDPVSQWQRRQGSGFSLRCICSSLRVLTHRHVESCILKASGCGTQHSELVCLDFVCLSRFWNVESGSVPSSDKGECHVVSWVP
jgi:hypothetical protein